LFVEKSVSQGIFDWVYIVIFDVLGLFKDCGIIIYLFVDFFVVFMWLVNLVVFELYVL